MKLAEALINRADLQTKILQLSQRLNLNSKFQEGESPDEDPIELMKLIDEAINELKKYIVAINMTNCQVVAGGVSLMEMIVERDSLTKKAAILHELAQSAGERLNRYSKSEIKMFSSVNVSDIQKQADELSKKVRAIDTKLQELNWTTDLIK